MNLFCGSSQDDKCSPLCNYLIPNLMSFLLSRGMGEPNHGTITVLSVSRSQMTCKFFPCRGPMNVFSYRHFGTFIHHCMLCKRIIYESIDISFVFITLLPLLYNQHTRSFAHIKYCDYSPF